jgi:D-sedoheptulose 7-phosphate isomerase
MNYVEVLRDRIDTSAEIKRRMAGDPELLAVLDEIAGVLVRCARAGGTVFFCGNGGSSSDAEHLSAELLGRFRHDRPSLPAYCLASNTAAMTAIGNDYSYELTFARPLAGLARRGDVLVALSTSGNSPNVLAAVIQAVELGVVPVAFTGADGGKVADLAAYTFHAPSQDTARVQECHMVVGHALCEIVESELHPRP